MPEKVNWGGIQEAKARGPWVEGQNRIHDLAPVSKEKYEKAMNIKMNIFLNLCS